MLLLDEQHLCAGDCEMCAADLLTVMEKVEGSALVTCVDCVAGVMVMVGVVGVFPDCVVVFLRRCAVI